MKQFALFVVVFVLLGSATVFGLRQRGDYPWKAGRVTWQEKEMFDAIGKAWYLPVGPTGLRCQITNEHPQYFTVRYVFKDTPAFGKVNIGDIVVGANDVMLKRPHDFSKGSKGWDGPMTDMAKLIEQSQAKDGQLHLIVWPGGKKDQQKTVTVKIPAAGKFSPTFPFDCKRSDKLVDELCEKLASDWKRRDAAKGGITRYHMILAFMASGNKKYDPIINDYVSGLKDIKPDPRKGGYGNWHSAYRGIILGEYYKRTKDPSVLPAIRRLVKYYDEAMNHTRGAYSGNPTPHLWINNRKGYGPMAAPSGMSMLAMSIFKSSGIDVHDKTYKEVHQSYLRAARPDVMRIVYAFPLSVDHAAVRLKDPKRAFTDAGPGFRVPTGMKDIGEYTIEWPHPKEKRTFVMGPAGNNTDWVEKEKATNDVYMFFGNRPDARIIVRNLVLPEPTEPYKTTRGCAQAPVGLGALAHAVGNKDRKSWQHLATHAGNSCALAYGRWFDGHASAGMHHLWVGLGAAKAEQQHYRKFMDGVKWWFIMQQTQYGTYLNCPNRDRPTGANKNFGPHTLQTANAVLMLAVPRKALLITGAAE